MTAPQDSFAIRRAAEDDADLSAALQIETWRETYRGIIEERYLDALDAGKCADNFSQALRRRTAELYFVFAGETPAGRLAVKPPEALGGRGEVQAIYLLQAYQGRGWGRRMMSCATARLWAMGAGHAVLWVMAKNHRAIAFYEKVGFVLSAKDRTRIGGKSYPRLQYRLENPERPPFPVRPLRPEETPALLELYTHLHGEPLLPPERAQEVMAAIQADPGHHILVAEADGKPVGSCVALVVPNLSQGGRPYLLIENVVTHPAYRRRGVGSAVLQKALQLAIMKNCYKAMLLTGRKDAETLRFYEKAGFNSADKTAFVQWL